MSAHTAPRVCPNPYQGRDIDVRFDYLLRSPLRCVYEDMAGCLDRPARMPRGSAQRIDTDAVCRDVIGGALISHHTLHIGDFTS